MQSEVSGWFLRRDAPVRWPASRLREIGRGNLAEFLAWGLFHCDPEEVPAERRAEFEQVLEEGSKFVDVDFPPGYNQEVRCMRLTMDRIESEHRPLVYYAVSAVALPLLADLRQCKALLGNNAMMKALASSPCTTCKLRKPL